MIDYWLEKRRLRKQIRKVARENDRFIIAATEGFGKLKERREEFSKTQMNQVLLEEKLSILEGWEAIKLARHYGIELPKESAFRKSWDSDLSILDSIELAKLRKRIREERRSNIKWWVNLIAPLLAPLVGLIGALIGLLAFLKG